MERVQGSFSAFSIQPGAVGKGGRQGPRRHPAVRPTWTPLPDTPYFTALLGPLLYRPLSFMMFTVCPPAPKPEAVILPALLMRDPHWTVLGS